MTLIELIEKCKVSVHLDVNDHRSYYQSVEAWLEEESGYGRALEISEEERAAIVASDTCYRLQFYPSTPIGFYCVYGATLESVLRQAATCRFPD